MRAWSSKLRATGSLLKEMADDWMEDNVLRLSAALAYYSIFSIAPLLVIAVGIAGWVLGPDAVHGHLDDQLRGMMGPEAAKAVQSMVQSASKPSDSAWATAIGFLTLLLGASGVFGQLKDALNTIWEVKALRSSGLLGFVKERLLSFGMVLVIGFLLLTSLVLTTALAALMKYFGGMFPIPEAAVGITGFVVSAGIVTTLFALILKCCQMRTSAGVMSGSARQSLLCFLRSASFSLASTSATKAPHRATARQALSCSCCSGCTTRR